MEFKVNVIVCCKDVGPYIDQCLYALANQTLPGCNILCIFSPSKDNTEEVIVQYTQQYDNIFLHQEIYPGPGGARKTALPYLSAPYTLFVDPDDVPSVNMCELLYEHAQKTNADMVIGGFDQFIDGHFDKSYTYYRPQNRVLNNLNEKLHFPLAVEYHVKLFKTEFFTSGQVPFIEKYVYDDKLIVLMCFFLAKKVVELPFEQSIPLLWYRLRPNSTVSNPGKNFVSFLATHKFLFDWAEKQALDFSILKYFYVSTFHSFCFLLKQIKKHQKSRLKPYFKEFRQFIQAYYWIENTNKNSDPGQYLLEQSYVFRNYRDAVFYKKFIKKA